MKNNWFYSVLFVVLTTVGVSWLQEDAPNQQMVVQLTNDVLQERDAQEAIDFITSQLSTIGVENVHTAILPDGAIKIQYYSTVNVGQIQQLFAQQQYFSTSEKLFYNTHSNTDNPADTSFDYHLDITEIQDGDGVDSGMDGALVELDLKHTRFTHSDYFYYVANHTYASLFNNDHTAYKVQRLKVLTIQSPSYKIPETRAGPLV